MRNIALLSIQKLMRVVEKFSEYFVTSMGFFEDYADIYFLFTFWLQLVLFTLFTAHKKYTDFSSHQNDFFMKIMHVRYYCNLTVFVYFTFCRMFFLTCPLQFKKI
jgi:hypothetical protein